LDDHPDEDQPDAAPGTLTTALDLYRIGDAAGPRLDAVRPGLDVSVKPVNGVDWVDGTPNGGASMRSSIYPLRRASSRWWLLPAGSPYSSQLVVRNDHGNHWLVEPATDLPLDAYENLLRTLNGLFV
jgi:hypothetical protein